MTVVTRFPPSPTGTLHIGGARTAFYNWLYARHHGGKFVFRLEDTDRERSTDAAVQAILDGMQWLGLDYDDGPYYQTQRFDRYREVVEQLLATGHAYRCWCTPDEVDAMREAARARGEKPKYNGYWRDRDDAPPSGIEPVIRFKNPLDGDVVIDDRVRGEVRIANAELDDLVIARADGTPTYHLTVVVDDLDMGITHVIRGDDHLSNTPRQINILKALGADLPVYAHLPMILGSDGKRMSKRHGAVSVTAYRDEGFLPDGLLNYLVRLGWSHGDQEIFSREELVAAFDITGINRAPSTFDPAKLAWVNHEHMQRMPAADLAQAVFARFDEAGLAAESAGELIDAVTLFRERANTLVELTEALRPYFSEFDEYDAAAAKKHLRPVAAEPLSAVREQLAALPDWSPVPLHHVVEQTAESLGLGMGKVGMPLRVAVTGTGQSPGLGETLELVGRARALARIDRALEFIAARAAADSA